MKMYSEFEEINKKIEAKLSWWIHWLEEIDVQIGDLNIDKVFLVNCEVLYLEEIAEVISFDELDNFCKKVCPIYDLVTKLQSQGKRVKLICTPREGDMKRWYIQLKVGKLPKDLWFLKEG